MPSHIFTDLTGMRSLQLLRRLAASADMVVVPGTTQRSCADSPPASDETTDVAIALVLIAAPPAHASRRPRRRPPPKDACQLSARLAEWLDAGLRDDRKRSGVWARTVELVSTVKDSELVESRRALIAATAMELARRQGFAHTTTRLIATGAGINIATMYQYFRSKQDILFYVCRKNFEEIQAVTGLPGDDPVGELKARFFNLIDVTTARQMEITFVYQESHTLKDDYLSEVKAWDERAVDNFEEPLKHAVAGGAADVDNTRVAARQMVETGYAWANKHWALRAFVTSDEYAKTHWRWFCAAFAMSERES